MFKIIKKERLNPTVTKMVIDAPFDRQKGGARPVHHPACGWRTASAFR